MLVRYQTPGSPLSFEFEAVTTGDITDQLSKLGNVFGADNNCGMCESPEIRWVVQENTSAKGTFTFHEKRCQCGARLRYGVRQADGELFPRKKDQNGSYIPNGGWEKYQPRGEQGESPQYSPAAGGSQDGAYPPPPSGDDPF